MGIFDLFSNETKQRDKFLRKYSSEQLQKLFPFLHMHSFLCYYREPLYDDDFARIEKIAEQIKKSYGVGLEASRKLCDYAVECKRNGKLKEAIAFYGEASKVMPTRSMTYYSLGKTLYLSNHYNNAISAYILSYILADEVTPDLYRHAGHAALDKTEEDSPNAMEYRVSIGGLQPRVIEGKQFYAYKLGYESNNEVYIKRGKEFLMFDFFKTGIMDLIIKNYETEDIIHVFETYEFVLDQYIDTCLS